MPFTSNMQFEVPARGTFVGTWDLPVNGDWGIADSAFGAVTALALSNSPVTLTDSQAQASVLRFSGVLTANVAVTIPATIRKFWIVENLTTGAFVVTLTNGSGQVVGLPPGDGVQVYSDGTDVKFVNLGRVGQPSFWYTSALPAWVLACSVPPYLIMDGASFSAVTWPALATFLGGTTLPDFRGYAPWSIDPTGTRINGITMSPNGNTVGAIGGSQTVLVQSGNLPNEVRSVTITDPGHFHSSAGIGTGPIGGQGGPGGIIEIQSQGAANSTDIKTTGISGTVALNGGQPHVALHNMPPAKIAGIFVIKT